ncbi:MAG TPA: acyl-CoA dehydrogenase family protein [Acidimicrobiia bacterium]|jgi:alkylation response protein AidB-like acyl-CoA dehydrogenase|nr:acyl-CoA dehydrogenase family protein [Acidimicrobiia bacterium]
MTTTAAASDTGTGQVDALVDRLLEENDPADATAFRGAQYDLGLAWVWFPVGFGGLGLAPDLQRRVEERIRAAGVRADALERNGFGIFLAAPTIAAHADDELKARLLRPLFTGEELWCQLFSEPGAGSDLAGLSTRAVRDGEEWVVDGQKVWNTLAHRADRGMLVARTDPDAPKHRGLTYFALDMHAPGVDVRPLRQITGEAEFNEVYLTGVRVPDADRIGGLGDGWRVSLTTLMNERVTIGGAVAGRNSGPIGDALKVWREHPESHDPVRRDRLARLWIDAEVLRLTNARAMANRKAGAAGPEGSVAKLAFAETNRSIYELCMDVLGADGLLYPSYEMVRPEEASLTGGGDPRKMFLRSRAYSIEGGTSEILRNVLGERVLGLPGEPRVDKGLPWNEVPRS